MSEAMRERAERAHTGVWDGGLCVLGPVELAVAWAAAATLLGEPSAAAVELIEAEHITPQGHSRRGSRFWFSPAALRAIAASTEETQLQAWRMWAEMPLRSFLVAELGEEWAPEIVCAVAEGVALGHQRLLRVQARLATGQVVFDCRRSAADVLAEGFPWVGALGRR